MHRYVVFNNNNKVYTRFGERIPAFRVNALSKPRKMSVLTKLQSAGGEIDFIAENIVQIFFVKKK